eukprot:4271373-Pleurochrysis_carterae.AAC.1
MSALKTTIQECDFYATSEERTRRAHEPVAGQLQPCDCCSFGHDPLQRDAEYRKLYDKLYQLRQAVDTSDGKKELSAFISKHKRVHRGTRPGPAGIPFTSA